MLTNAEHPVAWAMLVDGLNDTHKHLGNLIAQMVAEGRIDEIDFSIQLGHICAHLNRAWHGRNDECLDDMPDKLGLWEERSRFPVDLTPVG